MALSSQMHNLNLHGQTARYERKWKDVFDQKNLLQYAKKVGKKWRNVGIHLNMSEAELDTFEMDNHGQLTNIIMAMLNSFKNGSQKYGTPAQIEDLAEAFESSELMELACDVRGNDPTANHSPIPNTIPQQETLSPGITSYKNISPRVQGQVTYPNPSLGGYSEVLPWTDQKMYEKWNSDRDSVYKMTASPRGIALIININTVEGIKDRDGSAEDFKLMQKLFQDLGFEVISRKNLSTDDIKAEISNISNSKDSNMKLKIKAADCVVVFLMSHGQRDEIFGSEGRVVRCEDLIGYFQHNKSVDLCGKPVLFFIQACRGALVDKGQIQPDDSTPADRTEAQEDTDYTGQFVKAKLLPETADILIAYSSVPGYKSYRNTVSGSWFVTQVFHVFSKYAKEDHVEELLTRVRKCVTESTQAGFQPPTKDPYKQCTETVSRLTKKLYFFPGMYSPRQSGK